MDRAGRTIRAASLALLAAGATGGCAELALYPVVDAAVGDAMYAAGLTGEDGWERVQWRECREARGRPDTCEAHKHEESDAARLQSRGFSPGLWKSQESCEAIRRHETKAGQALRFDRIQCRRTGERGAWLYGLDTGNPMLGRCTPSMLSCRWMGAMEDPPAGGAGPRVRRRVAGGAMDAPERVREGNPARADPARRGGGNRVLHRGALVGRPLHTAVRISS